jgi:hypothetical protein
MGSCPQGNWPKVAAVCVLPFGSFGIKLSSNIDKNFMKCRQSVTLPALYLSENLEHFAEQQREF